MTNIIHMIGEKLKNFKNSLQSDRKHQSAFAGILLGTGLSIYALVPTTSHIIQGEPGSGFGSSVSQGDMNGDGIIDMLVGSPNTDSYSVVLMNSDGSEKSRITKTYNEVMNPVQVPAQAPIQNTETPAPNNTTGAPAVETPAPAPSVPAVPVPNPEVSPAPAETPAPAQNSNTENTNTGNTNTGETAPSAPAQTQENAALTPAPMAPDTAETPQTPPSETPSSPSGFLQNIFGTNKASAQSLSNHFGQFVFALPDINADSIPDLLISNDTSSYIIFQNADFSVKSFITLSQKVTHGIKNADGSYLFRTQSGDIIHATLSQTELTILSTMTTGTTSFTGGYDLDSDGINDIAVGINTNDIAFIALNADYTTRDTTTLQTEHPNSILAFVPDMNRDNTPELFQGDSAESKTYLHILKYNTDTHALSLTKTFTTESTNHYGKSIAFQKTSPFTFIVGSDDKLEIQEIASLPKSGKGIEAFVIQAMSDDFVITVKTDNAGTSGSTQFTIPTTGGGYSYNIDTNNDGINDILAQTGNTTITFGSAGTYTIRINGTFPRIYFNNSGDKRKMLDIVQWGTNPWTSMSGAFYGCQNMVSTTTDIPILSGVTDMSFMFRNTLFNNNLVGTWNVSNVTSMSNLFAANGVFNQNINSWDMGQVTTINQIFYYATSFNQPLNSWNTSRINIMSAAFYQATSFNQDISSWNTSAVTQMTAIFSYATAFNQPLNSWDVSHTINNAAIFYHAVSFNQPLNSWVMSASTSLQSIFEGATVFNQDISSWNVSNVSNMYGVFQEATAFNQPLDSWNTSSATNMNNMFASATSFNQNLGTC